MSVYFSIVCLLSYLSACLYIVCLSICLSICVCLFICLLSVCLFIRLSMCLFICLTMRLSVCPCMYVFSVSLSCCLLVSLGLVPVIQTLSCMLVMVWSAASSFTASQRKRCSGLQLSLTGPLPWTSRPRGICWLLVVMVILVIVNINVLLKHQQYLFTAIFFF